MCGIAGIYAYHDTAKAVDRDELVRIRDHMALRGPDGKGAWISGDARVGFGHRRLSIVDLTSAAAQPMLSTDGRYAVTFNGEIYNFRALRGQLEHKGYVFRTQSDTEVLLHLYADKGERMVEDLRGMFAFVIWDKNKRSLFLARDPYGIKPLYYADDGTTFRFASQVKALVASGQISRDSDPAGWVGFYVFGNVPEPYTVYRAVRSLPAGSTLWLDSAGAREPTRYLSMAEIYCQAETSPSRLKGEERQRYIRDALLDSVRHHLVADVPVGAFLSAGVDSGTLVGLMRDAGQQDIQTVTLAFEEFHGRHDDEAPLAAQVARLYSASHTIRTVTEAEFREDLPRILEAMDQPSVDGINTWFVSKAAHELGLKVAISGLGGDELLGGYSTFQSVPRLVHMLALPSRLPGAALAFRSMVKAVSPLWPSLSPKAREILEYGGNYPGSYLLRRGLFLPRELPTVLQDSEFLREGLARLDPLRYIAESLVPQPRTRFAKVATLESTLYMRNQLLRDTDWASMAHSLEVRVPLVDARLLQRIAPVTVGARNLDGKAWLAASPSTALPSAITGRAKTGFGVPVNTWLQRNVRTRSWERVPVLAARHCPWARRWAYQLVTA